MKDKAKKVTITLAIFLAVFMFFRSSQAVSVDELQKNIETKNEEIKKLEEETKKYRDEVVTTQQRSKTLKEEIKRIEQTVGVLRRDITLTEKKVQKTGLEIEELKFDIREKEISLGKLEIGLAGIIQSISEKDSESLLETVMRHAALSEFFQQLDYVSFLNKKILSSLDTLRVIKKELEVKKAAAEGKYDELENLEDALRDKKKIHEDTGRERSVLLKETQNQEKRYQEMLRDAEKKQEAILRDIEELEEELRKRIDPDSLPKPHKGIFAWPTEGDMSQGYGETPFTKSRLGRHFYKFHNGIDIKGAVGTPIYAVDDGIVLAVGDSDRYCRRGAYGKYIVLDHRNNLATMYAHLSFIKVSAGEEVKRGGIIGYMGNTGLSTGSHLHFTLYDARTVEIRMGAIGTCGLLPFGGSLNPLLYL